MALVSSGVTLPPNGGALYYPNHLAPGESPGVPGYRIYIPFSAEEVFDTDLVDIAGQLGTAKSTVNDWVQ